MRDEKWPGIPRMVVPGYITTGALGRGTLTKARGACPVRRTRDIMPGDKKKNLIPVKLRINVY